MIEAKDFLQQGLALHGHKCPAMPMGLRIGAAAMNKLGVSKAQDGQLLALVELGESHCATCLGDGIQIITGCTFGKGNIKKLNLGKFGCTLVDMKTGKAVRVVPKGSAMMANRNSKFFTEYREKGIPASQIPASVIDPMIEKGLNMKDEDLLTIGEVFDYKVDKKPHSFNSMICPDCQEMVMAEYTVEKNGKKICKPCSEK